MKNSSYDKRIFNFKKYLNGLFYSKNNINYVYLIDYQCYL